MLSQGIMGFEVLSIDGISLLPVLKGRGFERGKNILAHSLFPGKISAT